MSVAPTASAQTTSTIPATNTATVPRTLPSFSAIVPTASSTTEGSNPDSSLLPGGAATVTVVGLGYGEPPAQFERGEPAAEGENRHPQHQGDHGKVGAEPLDKGAVDHVPLRHGLRSRGEPDRGGDGCREDDLQHDRDPRHDLGDPGEALLPQFLLHLERVPLRRFGLVEWLSPTLGPQRCAGFLERTNCRWNRSSGRPRPRRCDPLLVAPGGRTGKSRIALSPSGC